MLFENLNLSEPILKALQSQGYVHPTPIQAQAIPVVLEGRDLLGCAQTGTGKTAAFAIPILQLLSSKTQPSNGIKALILTPTRELAVQIGDSFHAYGKFLKLRHTVVYGGVPQRTQTTALRKGVDVLIATPGRLLDLIQQGHINLGKIEILVLDEADRMLDMGFIVDIRALIAKLSKQRQTIFFSATMPKEIQHLADSILNDPIRIEVAPIATNAETIQQAIYFVEKNNKKALLHHIIEENEIQNVLVFTKTKIGADKVAWDLNRAGIQAEAIHGNKSQVARQKALNNFKRKVTRVLVATDIAARGIDVSDLGYVINYELPNEPETYVHRIGRTGRAGAKGIALSFCDAEERSYLRSIHKLLNKNIPIVEEHPYVSTVKFQAKPEEKRRGFGQKSRYRDGGSSSGDKSKFRRGGNSSGNSSNNNNSGANTSAKWKKEPQRRRTSNVS